jgi:hypothetical protein
MGPTYRDRGCPNTKRPKILIKPVAKYVMMDGLGDLYKVLNAVQQHNETATGYRIKDKRRSSHERRMNIIAIEPIYAFEFSMIRIKGRDS